jgi:SAM-dependent methyltransferase
VTAIGQHLEEMSRNQKAWENKPVLREIYAEFYRRIAALVDPTLPGPIVEIGSGIGNLKSVIPGAIRTDLFENPWLDVVCDGYELPFRDGALSHLVLFDVFHHLEAPAAFLREAWRAVVPGGRIIIFDPFISLTGRVAYGLFHHEPLGLRQPINLSPAPPRPRGYYAAQGNATRLFFRRAPAGFLRGWDTYHREAFSGFGYLLSGGYSKPTLYPAGLLQPLRKIDRALSRWPRLFGARCLVGLRKNGAVI